MVTIRLASGSETLSLILASQVQRRLEGPPTPASVHAVPVDSSGGPAPMLARLAEAVLGGAADAAVLPASILPLTLPPGVAIAAVLRESDPRYRCLAATRASLAALPTGSKILVTDPTARAQISIFYPGLKLDSSPARVDLCEGLRHGLWTAACVAPEIALAASTWGLEVEPISADDIVPCVGQGVAALIVSVKPGPHHERLKALDEPETAACLRAERTFLRHSVGVPGSVAAARAFMRSGNIVVVGLIAAQDGVWMTIDQAEGSREYGEIVARDLADACVDLALTRRSEPVPLSEPAPIR